MSFFTTTDSHSFEKPLTLTVLREAREKMEALGRTPVIRYSHFVDEIYEGELIDTILKETDPSFDPEIHKGLLVPVEHKEFLESHGIHESG